MLDQLVSELKLELTFRHSRRRFERESKPADAVIEVKPGEVRNLGEVKIKNAPSEPRP